MKMAAEEVLKDIRKLSVDELVALHCSVQNFGFEPEVRRGLEAKIQQRALKLMDRLNRQPNIYADLPDVEKLVKVFGEYNHERKLIYPVAHSLKIKIHKTKCYFEKNPVLREEALRQREQRRGKTFEIRFEHPETNREKKVVANEPQASEPRVLSRKRCRYLLPGICLPQKKKKRLWQQQEQNPLRALILPNLYQCWRQLRLLLGRKRQNPYRGSRFPERRLSGRKKQAVSKPFVRNWGRR